MIGFDPGDQPVPYEHWPESLKTALEGIVPGVDVLLFAGFSESVGSDSEAPQPAEE